MNIFYQEEICFTACIQYQQNLLQKVYDFSEELTQHRKNQIFGSKTNFSDYLTIIYQSFLISFSRVFNIDLIFYKGGSSCTFVGVISATEPNTSYYSYIQCQEPVFLY